MDHPVIYPTALEALKGTDVQTVVVCSVKDFLPPLKAVLGGLLGKIPKAPNLDPKHLLFKEVLKTPALPSPVDHQSRGGSGPDPVYRRHHRGPQRGFLNP